MPLDLGGVQFSINVVSGDSAKNAREVAAAFKDLNEQLQKSIDLQGKVDISAGDKPSRSSRSSRQAESSPSKQIVEEKANIGQAASAVAAAFSAAQASALQNVAKNLNFEKLTKPIVTGLSESLASSLGTVTKGFDKSFPKSGNLFDRVQSIRAELEDLEPKLRSKRARERERRGEIDRANPGMDTGSLRQLYKADPEISKLRSEIGSMQYKVTTLRNSLVTATSSLDGFTKAQKQLDVVSQRAAKSLEKLKQAESGTEQAASAAAQSMEKLRRAEEEAKKAVDAMAKSLRDQAEQAKKNATQGTGAAGGAAMSKTDAAALRKSLSQLEKLSASLAVSLKASRDAAAELLNLKGTALRTQISAIRKDVEKLKKDLDAVGLAREAKKSPTASRGDSAAGQDVKVAVDKFANLQQKTVADLRKLASELNIEGRSKMRKDELVAAIQQAMPKPAQEMASGMAQLTTAMNVLTKAVLTAAGASTGAATTSLVRSFSREDIFSAMFAEYMRRQMSGPARLTNQRGFSDLGAGGFIGIEGSPIPRTQGRIGTSAFVNAGPPQPLRLEDKRRGMIPFAKDASNAASDIDKLDMSLMSVYGTLKSLVGAFASVKIANFAKEATLLAGRVENLDTILRNTAATANFSGGQVTLYEEAIKQLGITTQAARSVMTRFAQNQLELSDAVQVSRIAQDAAVVAGINSSQATERMTVAIQRLDTRMLRNLGILVNLRQEYQRYGLETGRVETSLTAAEKQQLVLNAVIREGAALAGNYEAALGDVYKRFTSLDRKIEEATRTFGEQFLPAFGVAVDAVDAMLTAQANLGKEQTTFNSLILGAEATLATTVVTFVGLGSAITLARGAMISYNQAVLGMSAANATAAVSLRGLQASFIAFLKSPVGLFVAGAAAIAGTIALVSSAVQSAKAAKEKLVRDTEFEVAESASVRELVADIERLSEVQNRNDLEESRLLENMQGIIALAGDAGAELANLTGDVQAFLQATFKRFPGADTSLEDQLAAVAEKGRLAEEQLDKLRKLQEDTSTTDRLKRAFGLGSFTEASGSIVDPETGKQREFDLGFQGGVADRLMKQGGLPSVRELIEELEAYDPLVRKRAIERELNATRLRRLEDSGDRADTAEQLALRLKSQLEGKLIEGTGDSSLGELADLQKMQSNLASSLETQATIYERYEQRLTKIALDYNQRREQIRKQFADDPESRINAEAELNVSRSSQVQSANSSLTAELRRLENTQSAQQDLNRLSSELVEKRREEVQVLQQRVALLKQGKDPAEVDELQQINQLQREAATTAEMYDERLQTLNAQLEELKRAQATAGEEGKAQLQQQVDIVQSLIDKVLELKKLDGTKVQLQIEEKRAQSSAGGGGAASGGGNKKYLVDGKYEPHTIEQVSTISGGKAVYATALTRRKDNREVTQKFTESVPDYNSRKSNERQLEDLAQSIADSKQALNEMPERYNDVYKDMADAAKQMSDATTNFADAERQAALQATQDSISTEQFIAQESGDTEEAARLGKANEYISAASGAVTMDQVQRITQLAEQKGLGDFAGDIMAAGQEAIYQREKEAMERREQHQQAMDAAMRQIEEGKKQLLELEKQTQLLEKQLYRAREDYDVLQSGLRTEEKYFGEIPWVKSSSVDTLAPGSVPRLTDSSSNASAGSFGNIASNLQPRSTVGIGGSNQPSNATLAMSSSFPVGFDASVFTASVSRLGDSSTSLQEGMMQAMQTVAEAFDTQSQQAIAMRENLNQVAKSIASRQQKSNQLASSAGLFS